MSGESRRIETERDPFSRQLPVFIEGDVNFGALHRALAGAGLKVRVEANGWVIICKSEGEQRTH